MGGGASSFKMHATGATQSTRPRWLAAADQRIQPLSAAKFKDIVGIGKGKFGFVFLSTHAAQGKCVAIKYISKTFVTECKSVERIRQEIEVVKKLDHPFIIHCYGGFDTPACVALVFEYACGGELFTHMKKKGKMNEQHAKFYFCEMASAINYLHNKIGVVYRDLKPENVLLDYQGHCKLVDFGFAVPVNDKTLHDGCGTAMYVAPEIASGFDKSSHGFPVDWWGLGCVLAEMVTGHAPFGDTDEQSKFEIFSNITEKSPALKMTMSGAIKTIIKGLLNKDQKERWKWEDVEKADFCKDVNWEDVESRSINPPWVPPAMPAPASDNFVSWNDMKVPTKAADNTATTYCAVLDAAKGGCRQSRYGSGIDSPDGTGTNVSIGNSARSSPVNMPEVGGSNSNTNSGMNTPVTGTPVQHGRKSLRKTTPGSPGDSGNGSNSCKMSSGSVKSSKSRKNSVRN